MRSLHEAFETVLQFLEGAAAEPARLASPLALAAVRTLGRYDSEPSRPDVQSESPSLTRFSPTLFVGVMLGSTRW